MNKYLEKIAAHAHERAIQDILDGHEDRAFEIENEEDGDYFEFEDNDLNAAKKLMALKGLQHLANENNAGSIVHTLNDASTSHMLNIPANLKFLGTLSALAGGTVLGHSLAEHATSKTPLLLGGALAGAAGGGYLGYKYLSHKLNDKIQARNQSNDTARAKAIEEAYEHLRNRYGH